jgi:hypothetical protein
MPWKVCQAWVENDLSLKERNKITPEEKLVSAGWEKQATYDDPRLSEMVDMYKQIGFEVHLEPFNADNEEGCTGCMTLFPDQFKTIYTRRKNGED